MDLNLNQQSDSCLTEDSTNKVESFLQIEKINKLESNKLTGSPLTGSYAQGDLYDQYEATAPGIAIEFLTLYDLSGDNSISAISEVDNEIPWYSNTIYKSHIETGDGKDTFLIKNSNGYNLTGLYVSQIYTGLGDDVIDIQLLEHGDSYGFHALEASSIETEGGNDEVLINILTSKDDEFTAYALKNSFIKLGAGNDILDITLKNPSGNLDAYIAGTDSDPVLFDLGYGDDEAQFKSEGYGIKSEKNRKHKILLGGGNDELLIDSEYSSLVYADLYGGEGNDSIELISNNLFHYAIEDSFIYLEDGDDQIKLNSSKNSSIDGGTGTDVIVLNDKKINYQIDNKGDGSVILTKEDDLFYKLELVDFEVIVFSDQELKFEVEASPPLIAGPSGVAGDSSTSLTISEGHDSSLYTFNASKSVTWSLSPVTNHASDIDNLNIDSSTGDLTFKKTPDYENPLDTNGDNVYKFEVEAKDWAGLSSRQSVELTVKDIDEQNEEVTTTTGVTEPYQTAFTAKEEIIFTPGKDVTLEVLYSTSDEKENLTGLTLNLHYDSKHLTPTNLDGVDYQHTASITEKNVLPDTSNLDNDNSTDKIIQLIWADLNGKFPGIALPAQIATVSFSTSKSEETIDSLTGEPKQTRVNYSDSGTSSNYDFLGVSTILIPGGVAYTLDVDGDGKVTAFGDGLMIIRKLFGAAFAGEALTSKAISNDATRSSDEIHDYIGAMTTVDPIS